MNNQEIVEFVRATVNGLNETLTLIDAVADRTKSDPATHGLAVQARQNLLMYINELEQITAD